MCISICPLSHVKRASWDSCTFAKGELISAHTSLRVGKNALKMALLWFNFKWENGAAWGGGDGNCTTASKEAYWLHAVLCQSNCSCVIFSVTFPMCKRKDGGEWNCISVTRLKSELGYVQIWAILFAAAHILQCFSGDFKANTGEWRQVEKWGSESLTRFTYVPFVYVNCLHYKISNGILISVGKAKCVCFIMFLPLHPPVTQKICAWGLQ